MRHRHEPTNPQDREVEIARETGEHIASDERHGLRRKEDKRRQDFIDRFQEEPLTIKKLFRLLSLFSALIILANQGINWYRANNVTPEAYRKTEEKIDRVVSRVDSVTKKMDSLIERLDDKQDGDNFFYYSICFSWKQRFPTQYPAFCDRPEIRQFDPLGRSIPNPR